MKFIELTNTKKEKILVNCELLSAIKEEDYIDVSKQTKDDLIAHAVKEGFSKDSDLINKTKADIVEFINSKQENYTRLFYIIPEKTDISFTDKWAISCVTETPEEIIKMINDKGGE